MKLRSFSGIANMSGKQDLLCPCGYKIILSSFDDNVYCSYCKFETHECKCDKAAIEAKQHEELEKSAKVISTYLPPTPTYFNTAAWESPTSTVDYWAIPIKS